MPTIPDKPTDAPAPFPPDPVLDEGDRWNYRVAFQTWIVFFFLALAVALLNFLVSFFKG